MGPLAGIRIVEFAGIGPGPMAAMLFADLGAEVVRIDRTTASDLGIDMPTKFELLHRSRPSIAVDLKRPEGIALAIELIEKADALIEGFRPRHDGTAWPRPRRSARAQSALGLWPDDRMGTIGTAGAGGGS